MQKCVYIISCRIAAILLFAVILHSCLACPPNEPADTFVDNKRIDTIRQNGITIITRSSYYPLRKLKGLGFTLIIYNNTSDTLKIDSLPIAIKPAEGYRSWSYYTSTYLLPDSSGYFVTHFNKKDNSSPKEFSNFLSSGKLSYTIVGISMNGKPLVFPEYELRPRN